MLMRQYELESESGGKLLTWLPVDAKLYQGSVVSLKEYPEEKWFVVKRYDTMKRKKDIQRDWKVGGL